VQDVGLSATAVSLGSLVVVLTQFGTSYSLPRFLPGSTNRAAVINTALTVTLLASLFGAVIVLVLPVSAKLYALGGVSFAVAFLLATLFLSGATLLHTVLVAERAAGKLARANLIPNILRLAAPAIFLVLGSIGAYVARVASDVVSFFILIAVIARRGHRFRISLNLHATRQLNRFSSRMYVAGLIGGLPLMVLPSITLARFGSRQSAFWAVGIAVATLLYQLPSMIGQALLPEAVQRQSEIGAFIRKSALLIIIMMIPVLAIAYILAPDVLALLGARYVAGSLATLRWLIISGFIIILNYPAGSILLLAKKTTIIGAVNLVDAIVVIGLASTWARNGEGVAISWVIGDIGNTVLFCGAAVFALWQVGFRWENLAGRDDDKAQDEATAMSDGAALDMLLGIARLQGHGPIDRTAWPADARSVYVWPGGESQYKQAPVRNRPPPPN